MKKIFLFLLMATFYLSSFSQGIIFEENHNLNEALAKAKTENKLVFIDAYASWCGPCKMMAKEIFPQKEVGDYYNAHFVNLKLDMETTENIPIAKKYEVQAYPTYLYLNSDGEVVHRALGGMPVEEFIKVGKTAGDTENNAMSLTKKIQNGDRSLKTLKKYFAINPYDKGNEQLFTDYFNKLPDEQKTCKETWNMFDEFVHNPKGELFQYLIKNRTNFEEKIGKNEIEKKMMEMFGNAYYNDKDNFENYKSIDPALFDKTKARILVGDAYSKFRKNKEDKTAWNNFIAAANPYLTKKSTEASEMNNLAWFVYENYKKFNDKKALKAASNWAKKATQLAPEQDYILDTYAKILFTLGKKKEAISIETKALELATKANKTQNIESFKKTIENFKK